MICPTYSNPHQLVEPSSHEGNTLYLDGRKKVISMMVAGRELILQEKPKIHILDYLGDYQDEVSTEIGKLFTVLSRNPKVDLVDHYIPVFPNLHGQYIYIYTYA